MEDYCTQVRHQFFFRKCHFWPKRSGFKAKSNGHAKITHTVQEYRSPPPLFIWEISLKKSDAFLKDGSRVESGGWQHSAQSICCQQNTIYCLVVCSIYIQMLSKSQNLVPLNTSKKVVCDAHMITIQFFKKTLLKAQQREDSRKKGIWTKYKRTAAFLGDLP